MKSRFILRSVSTDSERGVSVSHPQEDTVYNTWSGPSSSSYQHPVLISGNSFSSNIYSKSTHQESITEEMEPENMKGLFHLIWLDNNNKTKEMKENLKKMITFHVL